MSYCGLRRLLLLAVILGLQCSLFNLHAQITIGGNVYGGGNEGDVKGNTTVTVRAGDIGVRADADAPANKNAAGKVFGGARMANVGGNAYVHIDGANATGDIIINQVFGGNDISGVVGADKDATPRLPEELKGNTKGVDETWNSFVRTSSSEPTTYYTQAEIDAAKKGDPAFGKTTSDKKNDHDIFIGQLFGGGNGNYEYEDVKTDADGTPNESGAYITHNIYLKPKQNGDSPIAFKTTPAGESGFNIPDLDRSFIDLHGGTISDAYGGGNNATVNDKAVICVDNPSMVVTQINDASGNHLLTEARYREMGVWNSLSDFSSSEFQIGALFGGNNQATMAIRPTWHLQKGQIRNLYSGGNRGDMIYETGLFLEIPSTSPELKVDNLFGGCRMADVRPMAKNALGEYEDVTRVANDIPGYAFPANFAARVIVAGGDVNNVYGGNDVRGKVYFGNAVGIQASIRGDVYGGGNGNYPYTDNSDAMEDEEFSEEYGDYYYDPGNSSIDSLNAIRPNAEQVSIQVRGTESKPTIIGGAIYVGGNCATLKADPENHGYLPKYPITELKIGSYVIADSVFLGNNGAGLVDEKNLKYYANEHGAFSSLGLEANPGIFAKYMLGVALSQVPELKVESTDNGDRVNYEPYTSYIGSLYYGGNRGSMTFSGPINITPSAPIYIYDKLVAGCNNANVAKGPYNAAFKGGIMGDETERRDGYTGDRVTMTLSKIKMVPMRLNSARNGLEWNTFFKADYVAVENGTTLTKGETYYTSIKGAGEFIAAGNEVANGTNYFVKTDGYVKTDTGSGEDVDATQADVDRRLRGANVYGGCCESGYVNGNVVININGGLHERDKIFATINRKEGDTDEILYDYELKDYHINKRNSGVILNEQGMDVLGEALNVFAGGKGKATEIWGSTTVNVNAGYTFQVFGGSESGIIGKSRKDKNEVDQPSTDLLFSGEYYAYDPAYSTTVNLTYADGEGVVRDPNNTSDRMADVEFMYGGGFEGPVCGNTRANLGNGRLFNLFTGSCNADILGHTETYVGKWTDAKGKEVTGFPYLRDHIYGGNDLGGEIKGVATFASRVNDGTLPLVHEKDEDDGTGTATIGDGEKDVLQASSYMEYRQGRMKDIFGGCFGDYDYDGEFKTYKHPHLNNAFVNFRPDKNARNHVDKVFGAGEGYLGDREGDKAQDRSYVLIDIAGDQEEFAETEAFGSGMNNGLGTRYGRADVVKPGFNGDKASAIIDLAHGMFGAAYGGSYNEGVTGRTVVRVPEGSTINIMNIFGGAYGTNPLPPCDVYASNVEYSSNEAVVRGGGIYGGNNKVRRTLYTKVDINSPVYANTDKSSLATVYGAGYGEQTWAEYTLVNLNDGAQVREVYGGGQDGLVLNAESIRDYMKMYSSDNVHTVAELPPHIKSALQDEIDEWGEDWKDEWDKAWRDAWRLGDYYNPTSDADFETYPDYPLTNLTNSILTREAEMDDRDFSGLTNEQKAKIEKKYNTNVIINKGASVLRYAYGGGLGSADKPNSGDVLGTTYIALLGGTVGADIYAAGTTGSVYNLYGSYGSTDFTASANAYIKGGTVRNVYGGGWEGNVGRHTGDISVPVTGTDPGPQDDDIPGETHVVIGDLAGTSFTNGIPAIQRNAYGGGEGGAVYGSSHLTLNNGYIGYEYDPNGSDNNKTEGFDEHYKEKIEDNTKPTPNTFLTDAGCIFGGGYVDNSSVDKTYVKMIGGHVRNSMFGGGEIAAIGRGAINVTTSGGKTTYTLAGLYRPGKTNIEMFGGHVHRNVFGGGRGYNNLGGHGSLNCDGFVFGQTEVHIHGGEIGTEAGLANNDGNVFGGGDIGYVYSAYEITDDTFGRGVKTDVRYGGQYQGYYYKHAWDNGGADEQTESLFVHENGDERVFTEDCRVLIEPQCKVLENVTINGHNYLTGDYVPIEDLNTLKNKTADAESWDKLDPAGIIIHNAVFAGGNTSSGSSVAYVNATSVFGNATASIHDVYNRDLITLGTRHTGGLYGDGNLTLVDGYRELNITNYGTDYYSIKEEIDIDTYHDLPAREAAYYELKYKCKKECEDNDGTHYMPALTEGGKASTITADDYFTVFKDKVYNGDAMIVPDPTDNTKQIPNPKYWEENGVLPVYAGRLMNSIQRADFCGVWGSRMVMQGAQDRVPEEADYTNYTINRVREVSLNKMMSTAGDLDDKNKKHGNYFGIYNIVNYLGALSSDVDFGDESSNTDADGDGSLDYEVRTTDNSNKDTYEADIQFKDASGNVTSTIAHGSADYTFYNWKKSLWNDRKRNNGKSHNKVALASGVYLELTTEQSTGDGLYEKDWGYITGVVELDLINVQPGIGGGFVYAKNVHGVRSKTNRKNTTLTALNDGAVTHWDFEYTNPVSSSATQKEWQTSGNFVHSTQTIIDDCYNVSAKYKGEVKTDGTGAMPAHYWYIKGEVYVYDQYISAYTGIPNAYSETVEIPLTITAASHGAMKLLNVQPNYYAYYSSPGVKLNDDQKIIINDKPYYKNDAISFWDYYLLSNSEKALFVPMTYVNCVPMRIDGGSLYEAGTYVMTQSEYEAFGNHNYTDANHEPILDGNKANATTSYIFRQSNDMSHNTGYILTYKVNNPGVWDTWYTPKSNSDGSKITVKAYDELDPTTVSGKLGKDAYEDGPTYRLISATGGVLGQKEYQVGDIISQNVYYTYEGNSTPQYPGVKPHVTSSDGKQATFDEAYIITNQVSVTVGTETHHYNPGSTVSKTVATSNAAYTGKAQAAYVCTSTIQLSKTEFIYVDTKMSKKERDDYYDRFIDGTDDEKKIAAEILAKIVPAYYCTDGGKYGGNYYESGKNYRGLEAWSSMSESDRNKFTFNYDALDLLIDPTYTDLHAALIANKYQYDGTTDKNGDNKITADDVDNKAGYSIIQPIDYTATYDGNDTGSYGANSDITLVHGKEYSRQEYEKLPNEQRYYTVITVKNGTEVTENEVKKYKVYVVNEAFQIGNTPYAAGTVIDAATYVGLVDKSGVTVLTFDSSEKDETYYYCRESYTVNENGSGVSVTNAPTSKVTAHIKDGETTTDVTKTGTFNDGSEVPVGLVINDTNYDDLVANNKQKDFTIHGISPTEVSTLYVSRESDIYNLSREKIITVVYQYDYDEVQTSGAVTPITERHVVNIHINFKSGVPIVEDITEPEIILPGDFITLRDPNTTPGAYEVTGGGWELFEKIGDAESHSNGIEYNPIYDPLYWYQDNWYVAYYAKTYLGRTYSNFVPVHVANYHDLDDVMSEANKEHHMYIDNPNVKREPKIYINDYSDSGQNGLDLFKDLYDLSLVTGSGNGYTVAGGKITAAESPANTHLVGHTLLGNRTRAERNLEFFLRTDIEHAGSWTSIGNNGVCDDPSTTNVDEAVTNNGQCFDGVFHGDGHTISGLDNSLFNYLCGEVYNLGVTGSFTGGGIAENGSGYVESCWVNTTGTPAEGVRAVFSNPSAGSGYKQLVNSYCQEGKTYSTTDTYNHGLATAMPDKAFYNGEVAYNLNNFYLYKRYNDNANPSGSTTYKYWLPNNATPQEGTYAANADLCSSGYNNLKYVENRFADGDFVYAAGNIPGSEDERYYLESITDPSTNVTTMEAHWYPIWPDDYLFFGQTLNYGYVDGQPHQATPSAINRSYGRVVKDSEGNRVYRAPAYFRSGEMKTAYFNPYAIFAQSKNGDASTIAYKGMTAIDFTDAKFGSYNTYKTYEKGVTTGDDLPDRFYQPLLDDDGLTNFRNVDLTQNLLVYTDAPGSNTTASEKTGTVVSGYLLDPAYSEITEDGKGVYRRVAYQTPAGIHGHWVQKLGSGYTALRDHLLVDKQDFNAPISYQFDTYKRMWYQRYPEDNEFVDRTKGWQAISLPFSAELVTTQQKGEITHFYDRSEDSKNGTRTKIGHEYWLREFKGGALTETSSGSGIYSANFGYPVSTGSEAHKTFTNSFLWDYYYNATGGHNHKDKNADDYQTYYMPDGSGVVNTYYYYRQLGKGTPYILGLPGVTYYEFDLSGNFNAGTTAVPNPLQLNKQYITFASNPGEVIQVSDMEMSGVQSDQTGGDYYTFKPTYLNNPDIPVGKTVYQLDTDGDSFDKKAPESVAITAFRPYFVSSTSSTRTTRGGADLIVFSMENNSEIGIQDQNETSEEELNGHLKVSAEKHKIIVSSTCRNPVGVRIVGLTGIVYNAFTIQPGETIETRVNNFGVYIVETFNGKYTKKITVK